MKKINRIIKAINLNNLQKTLIFITIILFLLPLFNKNGSLDLVLHLGIMVFIYIFAAQSWNLLAGYTGLFSFGHAVFYGVGAYGVAIFVNRLGLNPFIGFVAGIIVSIVLALILGGISAKLTGFYFTMSTIALSQVFRSVIVSTTAISGGNIGLPIARPGIPRCVFYYGALLLAILGTIFMVYLRKTRIGSMFVSIRENINLAKTLGVNTNRYKTLATVISAIMAAIAGAYMAYYIQVADISFGSNGVSIKLVIVTIVGGMGFALGPVIGAAVILIEEFVRGSLGSSYAPLATALYSVILIVMTMFKPEGLISISFKNSNHKIKGFFNKNKKLYGDR